MSFHEKSERRLTDIGRGRRHSFGSVYQQDTHDYTKKDIKKLSFFGKELLKQKLLTLPLIEHGLRANRTTGLTKNNSTGNMNEYIWSTYNKEEEPRNSATTYPSKKNTFTEEKERGFENENWKHNVMRCFNYLRENIDPEYLRDKLCEESFLAKDSVKFRNSDKTCIKSTQVMIAVAKKINDKHSYSLFEKILRREHACCAVKLDEQLNFSVLMHAERREICSEHSILLTEAKSTIEEEFQKLDKEKLLKIVGAFLERLIFDLSDIEDIIKYIIAGDDERMSNVFTDRVLKYCHKGSYGCLIDSLQYASCKIKKNISKRLKPKLHQAQVQVRSPASILESTENSMLHEVTDSLPSKLCMKHSMQVTKVKKGSIIIYLKSLKRENLSKKDIINKLFNDGSILESLQPFVEAMEIKEVFPGIVIALVGCDIIEKAKGTCDALQSPISIIEANKSFLIQEIDTGMLLAAFKKKGINYFEQQGFDLNADRKTRATKFLEIVEKDDKTEMLMDILGEEEMSYILERLTTYQRIYTTDIDSSILARSILLKFGELVENLEKCDIEDVFVERRIINREIFDEIEETFGDVSVAAILIEIINSGKDAMLSLIDILFLKEQCSLAQGFLESASADRGMHDVNDMTETKNEDYSSNTGTEFSITIKLIDIKGMQDQSTDIIIQDNHSVLINNGSSVDEQICTDETFSPDDGGSLESGYYSPVARSRTVSIGDIIDDDCNIPCEHSVQSSCGEAFNQSQVVIDLNRTVMYKVGDKIIKSDCKVQKHAYKSSDGVTFWYELEGAST